MPHKNVFALLAGVVLASLGFAWKSAQRISASRAVETGPGKAVQVEPMTPVLEAPGTKRFKPMYDNLISNVSSTQLAPIQPVYAGAAAAVYTLRGPLFFGSVTSFKAGPGGYCPPRHQTHFGPSFLESKGIL